MLIQAFRKYLRRPMDERLEIPGVYPREVFKTLLQRERERANRNAHGFSLVIFDMGSPTANPTRFRILASTLRKRTRSIDEVGRIGEGRVGVLLPDTSGEGAIRFVSKVSKEFVASYPPLPPWTVWTYPPGADGSGGNGHGPDGGGGGDVGDGGLRRQDAGVQPDMFGGMDPSVGSQGAYNKAATAPGRMGAREASRAILSVFAPPIPRWKRAVDIAGALFGLVVFSVPFLLIAILIKIASRGPVFFKQERVGRLGQRFVMWKFRTMVVDNNTSSHHCYMADLISAEGAEARPMVKQEDSRRLIFLGKVLRATCLDEVPQLLNVLKGEMSLVGPRPPIPYEAEEYLRWHSNRFDAVPGMTGLWQVSGKNNLTFNEMVRLDIRYARTLSLLRDVSILLRTPAVIVSQVLGAFSRYLQGEGSSHGGQETA